MDIVIYLEGCNSVVLRDNDKEVTHTPCGAMAWVEDPLGFVHPDGPFFDPY